MKIAKSIKKLSSESAFKVFQRSIELEKKGKKIIHLSLGQPDFKTPKNIVLAAKNALDKGFHGYTPSNGFLELRKEVSLDASKRYRANVDPENVLIVPGGKPIIFFSILMFSEPGSEIIYPDPGFPIYKSVIEYAGAKAVPLKLKEEDDFQINVKKMVSLINNKTRLIIINNPNNPTGSFMRKEKIDEIVNALMRFPHIAILSDEIYSRLIFDNHKMPSLLKYSAIRNRLIVLDGWSKTYCMTGWRLGWGIWPSNLINYANKLAVNDHSCANAVSQIAGIEALRGSQKTVRKILKEFQERRDLIYNGLNSLKNVSCFRPGGAFYAFPNVSKTNLSGDQFARKALEKYGVAVVSGSSFGNSATKYVRFSFANSKENITKALRILRKMCN
ncbi:MAG: Aspartate aminotransferase [Alphaproteobacteria bacterium MarineAlpha5_Bin11]|nr:MAG: Aspartate aminotransferase [Alphaproteobacteria bacterium MarineAlpha5_Bin11]|tara:strand:+ start:773 stop:1936 length:1164 start_codon:yes stop_codon:yes gene_type:complete